MLVSQSQMPYMDRDCCSESGVLPSICAGMFLMNLLFDE